MAAENSDPDEFVVIASLSDRRAAERLVASFGHKFRAVARKRHASALVVTANPDGSLKLTESRALESRNLIAVFLRLSLSWTVGFMGIVSGLKGTKEASHAAHVRERHVGSDEHPAHAILAEAGPHAAIVLVRCNDRSLCQEVATQASNRAINSWQASLQDFLAALDPGSQHDWVRNALGQATK